RDIGDMQLLLEESAAVPAPVRKASHFGIIAAVAAAVFLLAAAVLAFVHFQIATPGNMPAEHFKLSPDGRYLAFIAPEGGSNRLWLHALDSLENHVIPATEGATYPFWSPDGAYLGFFAQGKVKKVAVTGGPPQKLADAPDPRGGTWGR